MDYKPPELIRSISGQTYGVRLWPNASMPREVLFLQSGKVLQYCAAFKGVKAYKLYDGPWEEVEQAYEQLISTQTEYEVVYIPEPVFPSNAKYLEKHFSNILSQI